MRRDSVWGMERGKDGEREKEREQKERKNECRRSGEKERNDFLFNLENLKMKMTMGNIWVQ